MVLDNKNTEQLINRQSSFFPDPEEDFPDAIRSLVNNITAQNAIKEYSCDLNKFQKIIDDPYTIYFLRSDHQFVPNILASLDAIANNKTFTPIVAQSGMSSFKSLPEDPHKCLQFLLNENWVVSFQSLIKYIELNNPPEYYQVFEKYFHEDKRPLPTKNDFPDYVKLLGFAKLISCMNHQPIKAQDSSSKQNESTVIIYSARKDKGENFRQSLTSGNNAKLTSNDHYRLAIKFSSQTARYNFGIDLINLINDPTCHHSKASFDANKQERDNLEDLFTIVPDPNYVDTLYIEPLGINSNGKIRTAGTCISSDGKLEVNFGSQKLRTAFIRLTGINEEHAEIPIAIGNENSKLNATIRFKHEILPASSDPNHQKNIQITVAKLELNLLNEYNIFKQNMKDQNSNISSKELKKFLNNPFVDADDLIFIASKEHSFFPVDSAVLTIMLNHRYANRDVAACIVKHPNASQEIFEMLLLYSPYTEENIMECAIKRANTELLLKLINSLKYNGMLNKTSKALNDIIKRGLGLAFLRSLIQNPNTSSEMLVILLSDFIPGLLYHQLRQSSRFISLIVQHDNANIEVLKALLTQHCVQDNSSILELIVKNPNSTLDILKLVIKFKGMDSGSLQSIIENKHWQFIIENKKQWPLVKKLLMSLMYDDVEMKNIPTLLSKWKICQNDTCVCNNASTINSPIELLNILNSTCVSLEVLIGIANNPKANSEVLARVLQHDLTDPNILKCIVKNVNANHEILMKTLDHQCTTIDVLLSIVNNINVTPDVLIKILDNKNVNKDLLEEMLVIKNSNVNEEVLLKILSHKKILSPNYLDVKCLSLLIQNPKVNHDILLVILNHSFISIPVLEAIVLHDNASNQLLLQVLDHKLINNPRLGEDHIPGKILQLIVKHPKADEIVFSKILNYKNLSKSILLYLIDQKISMDTLIKIVHHQQVNSKILQLILTKVLLVNNSVLDHIAKNRQADNMLLLDIAHNIKAEEDTLSSVVSNPHADQEVFLAVVNNKNVTIQILDKIKHIRSIRNLNVERSEEVFDMILDQRFKDTQMTKKDFGVDDKLDQGAPKQQVVNVRLFL